VSVDQTEQVAEALQRRGWWLATAESVTAGGLAERAASGPGASDWFRGGLVAWSEQTKRDLLGVACPIMTAECAEQMARSVVKLLDADVAVATTGVGGPEPYEGQPPGSVWVAVLTPHGMSSHELHLEGNPVEVVEQARAHGWRLLLAALERTPVLAQRRRFRAGPDVRDLVGEF
jgi:nicotinamide-nucleotide amidase